MKSKIYECDGGTICIGTKEARVCIPNNFGDGSFMVFVAEHHEYRGVGNYDFKGAVRGENINVYRYDCLGDEDCENPSNVLFTLSGRFGIYVDGGDVVLERWD